MPNRPAVALRLRAGDRGRLIAITRSTSVRAGLAQRARILLLAADGRSNTEIAHLVGVSRPTVLVWRQRYAVGGLDGLADVDRPGRRPQVAALDVLAATLVAPPRRLGVTHWSSRLLGDELGVGRGAVMRAWHAYGLQPVRGGFRFATTTPLSGRVAAVLAVRLGAPESFAVLDLREPSLVAELRPAARPTVPAEALAELALALQHTPADHPENLGASLLGFLDTVRHSRAGWPTASRLHLVADGRGPLGLPAFREALAVRSRITVHVARDSSCWSAMLLAWLAMVAGGVDGPSALPALEQRRDDLQPGEVLAWVHGGPGTTVN